MNDLILAHPRLDHPQKLEAAVEQRRPVHTAILSWVMNVACIVVMILVVIGQIRSPPGISR